MAKFIGGVTGAVTSWANNTQLISTGNSPMSFTLDVPVDAPESTALTSTLRAYIRGLRSVTGTISGRLPTAIIGYNGAVAFAGGDGGAGYVTNINRWDLTVSCPAADTTSYDDVSGSVPWRAFIPSLVSWGGSYGGFQDDTTPLVVPGGTSEAAAATFTIDTGKTLAGTIIATRLAAAVPTADPATAEYTFQGSGDLTVTGANLPIAAGGLARPVVGSLVLTAVTGQTFTMDAFWTSIAFSHAVGDMVTIEVGFQGTGAITFG